jgi:hypothetical protein
MAAEMREAGGFQGQRHGEKADHHVSAQAD